jgi:hypothetical protein
MKYFKTSFLIIFFIKPLFSLDYRIQLKGKLPESFLNQFHYDIQRTIPLEWDKPDTVELVEWTHGWVLTEDLTSQKYVKIIQKALVLKKNGIALEKMEEALFLSGQGENLDLNQAKKWESIASESKARGYTDSETELILSKAYSGEFQPKTELDWSQLKIKVRPFVNIEGTESGILIPKNSILEKIMSWMGTPYRWGGTSRKGVDCSGFVLELMGEIGYPRDKLPRTARDLWQLGKPVSDKEHELGDLLFYSANPKKGITHVGIYKGNDIFVHSASSKGVTETDMNHPYWKKKYKGSRRFFLGNR